MDQKDIVYVNGSFVPRSEARVSVEDRGFVFGDGVYEVLRVINGRLFATRFHNQRLERSLEGVRIALKSGDSPARLRRNRQTAPEGEQPAPGRGYALHAGHAGSDDPRPQFSAAGHRSNGLHLGRALHARTPISPRTARPRSRTPTCAGEGAISRRSTCCPTSSLRRRRKSAEHSKQC